MITRISYIYKCGSSAPGLSPECSDIICRFHLLTKSIGPHLLIFEFRCFDPRYLAMQSVITNISEKK